jgi:DNA-binding transcriptional regulator YiaG
MSKLVSVLKDEVVRIARKEVRAETGLLRKASNRYRGEIAELKRQLGQLKQQLRKAGPGAAAAPTAKTEVTRNIRFRAAGLRGHRQRLGVTAKGMAALLEVSVQTLANWESGKTKPRASELGRLAAVRKLGKREAATRLSAQGN